MEGRSIEEIVRSRAMEAVALFREREAHERRGGARHRSNRWREHPDLRVERSLEVEPGNR
jgi:hypothetical protein